jgi:hypothetical protein
LSWQNRKAAADSAANKTMTSPEGLIKIYGMATANIFCELLLALFAGIKKARP